MNSNQTPLYFCTIVISEKISSNLSILASNYDKLFHVYKEMKLLNLWRFVVIHLLEHKWPVVGKRFHYQLLFFVSIMISLVSSLKAIFVLYTCWVGVLLCFVSVCNQWKDAYAARYLLARKLNQMNAYRVSLA